MTTGQTISIISAVIVSAIMISFSVISNTPTTSSVDSGDQMNVDNGKKRTTEESKKWNLKSIIESVAK